MTARAFFVETREHNERLVLATIYDESIVGRTDLARQAKLTIADSAESIQGIPGLRRQLQCGLDMATSTLVTLPVFFFFLIVQNRMVGGLTGAR